VKCSPLNGLFIRPPKNANKKEINHERETYRLYFDTRCWGAGRRGHSLLAVPCCPADVTLMAMRKSIRQELRKGRELLRFMLNHRFEPNEYLYYHYAPMRKRDWGIKCCCFCHKALLTPEQSESYAKDGDGQGSPLAISRTITIHHRDLNHNNDKDSNKTLAHSSCHRSFHMTLRHKQGHFRK
jgi:hypothetical protein